MRQPKSQENCCEPSLVIAIELVEDDVLLAEAGCNENTISAILGWANNKQAAHYTKAANREKMARQGIKAIS